MRCGSWRRRAALACGQSDAACGGRPGSCAGRDRRCHRRVVLQP
jgi:hypothetical protein